MPADRATDLQTLGRLQSDAPSAGIRYAKELLFLVSSDYATESRRKGIEQYAGDNHKGPSLCNKARPAREERTAFNRSESSLEGDLAKTDHHK